MKKTAIILIAIIAAVVLVFTGCDKDKNADNMVTTTEKVTTTQPATTMPEITTDKMMSTDENAGAPESTSQDSALADAVEGAADGVADANERIADGVRDAQNDNER